MESLCIGGQPSGRRWQAYLTQLAAVKPYLSPLSRQFRLLEDVPPAFVLDVPVRLDDGRVQPFEGYAVMHEQLGVNGPADVRHHRDVDLDEVQSRAAWRRLRHALVGLPLGGVAGGVRLSPAEVSNAEMTRVAVRFQAELSVMRGAHPPRPGAGVLTGTGQQLPPGEPTGAVTAYADRASGRGMFGIAKRVATKLHTDLQGARVAIHGLSGAAAVFAQGLSLAGAKIVAVRDQKGATADLGGINPVALSRWVRIHGEVANFPWAWRLSAEDFLEIPCDLLVLMDAEEPLTVEQAGRVRARLVMEGARDAISPEAELRLMRQGSVVVPDLLCEAARCALEHVRTTHDAGNGSEQDLRVITDRILDAALDSVWQMKTLHKVSLRQASVATACVRLLDGGITPERAA